VNEEEGGLDILEEKGDDVSILTREYGGGRWGESLRMTRPLQQSRVMCMCVCMRAHSFCVYYFISVATINSN